MNTSTPTLSTPTIEQPAALQPPLGRPAHAAAPARPATGIRAVFAWILHTERAVLDVLARHGILTLLLSHALVQVAFGALKIVGLSPVADLVASMVPFLPAQTAVIAMGMFEVVVGATDPATAEGRDDCTRRPGLHLCAERFSPSA
ncbi:MAG: hypothetical protein EAS51_10300 [Microbacteriaceae bacterium]|nr:MAG: hypothetical protein EAS51_10300 [Microbacteriaceae bacterium]